MKMNNRKTFLTAQWKNLIMVNYDIDPVKLEPYLPANTELDFWNKKCYISLVGFMFENVRVKGIKVPCHVNFPEVNLRFYVKYNDGNIMKRGVVFISEIVPKPAITTIANLLYNENYRTLPMKYHLENKDNSIQVTYMFKKKGWNSINVVANKEAQNLVIDSEEEFITEHFWGYAKKTDINTIEYEVHHPRWDIHSVVDYKINCNFEKVYGADFSYLNIQQPESVFLAVGSEVSVYKGKLI